MTPEDAQALLRWNLRHGNAESTSRATAMIGDQDPVGFRDWYVPLANKLGISPDPDDPEHYYDYRGFYDAMKRGEAISPDQPGGHFPSTFKTEGHPRTYLDDPTTGKVFDTRSAEYVGGGRVPQRALAASEQSPDKPGFDAQRAKLIAQGLGGLRFIPR